MHRNTGLLVSVLAVIASLLVGIQIGRFMPMTVVTQTPATPTAAPTQTPAAKPLVYKDETCKLSVTYPSRLQVLESTTSGTIFTNPENDDESIIVICQNEIPRIPLAEDKIESRVLITATGATVSAQLYHDASPQDGKPIDKIIFTHPKTGMDVLIAGFGAVYQQMLSSITLQ
jgi:hypothetical protein